MNKTVARTSEQPTDVLPVAEQAQERVQTIGQFIYLGLKALASLRLTVVFFALGIFLVFCGTVAMVDEGLWTVMAKYFRSWFVVIPFQVFVRFAQVFFGLSKDVTVGGGLPFLGGWAIGAVLMTNLLAAHLVRFKLSGKRAGILLIHSGIVVMMIGEFLTGMYQVEGHLRISTGGSSNFLEHYLKLELAVITRADAENDEVTAVPMTTLQKQSRVQHEDLPFDVELNQFMKNSSLHRPTEAEGANLATQGLGRQWVAVARPEVGGAESGQKSDVQSAYLTLRKKNSDEVLGTYLVSLWLELFEAGPQRVQAEGKTYEIGLRRQRIYKPYTVHLIEVKTDRYQGSSMAREFSSRVRLVDPAKGEDRESLISMNDPLRYSGETFYQSQVLGQDEVTVLQVVHNPGVLLPYLSCIMVSLGMLIHFGISLITFLQQRVL